jgi:V/A-type H+-transporting ATPase subunit E
MAETIESFVQKLQADGVQAGQQEAEKIRQAARKEADETLRQAKQEAEKIVAQARAEAEDVLARSKTELQLAARDAALRLREALSRALEAVLAQGAREKLADVSFLGQVMHDLVMLYARSQLAGEAEPLVLNVQPEMRKKLKEWALGEIGQQRVDSLRHAFDLKGTLSTAGFEYKASDATVEVTLDSVVQTLKELVGPSLQEVLDQALAEKES